ncbi:TonB-dependent receptor plug domain-containing protein [Inhella gelatinilytica]|uniref:TonB-dependent receptor n=1 Tax=Inhella gelatinilytica TaxID=2795030 RepID=A0A931IU59_9BURK|nr:TonB-dependent receptor [Inhella gelatinilytica]MBH9552204.1 TonB-dependent receptor [Inhella gelatinilytica]
MRRFLLTCGLWAATALHAQTQTQTPTSKDPDPKSKETPEKLDKVEVNSRATDESRRRASTASKIIISRDDLLRFGDGNLTDLMRRLPGVTPGGRPGRGGEIRMRGMGGGFTQILVDGERMPPGFSLDQIPPDQVERIEILRAPTAETGARAVAGTINVILREPLARNLHEMRASVGGDHGAPQANLSWTRNDTLAGGLNTSLTVVGQSQRRPDLIDTRQQGPGSLLTTQQGHSEERRNSLNANGRLQWRLGEGEQLMLMPFWVVAQTRNSSQWAQTGLSRYDAVHSEGDGSFNSLRVAGNYQKRWSETTRFDGRLSGGQTRLTSHGQRFETLAGTPVRIQDDQSTNRDRVLNGTFKLTQQTATEHNWVSGLELERNQRDNARTTLENGQPKPGLSEFGDELRARTQRLALYTQDEWQATSQWNLHAGLRWEGIESRGDAGALVGEVRNRSSVWSPLVHALWKPNPQARDQLRMSLTRSYRGANLNDLIARPSINNQFPSGANTELTPDRAGNPALKPELATGLELGWEHYLSKGGMLSANVFARQIQGLIRSVISLESVPWDAAPRYVARPRNLGDARTAGLELELKARVDELWAVEALPLQLRANVSLFTSQVEGIPGPHNRIDAQPRFSANVGADYRMGAWSYGANWSLTPEILIQQTETLTSRTSRRSVVDAYVQWVQSRALTWRLGLSNLAPLDSLSQTVIESGAGPLVSTDRKPSFTTWNLRAEMRF